MTYYYFDLLGGRQWADVCINGVKVLPLSEAADRGVGVDDVVYIHLSDALVANTRGFIISATTRLSIDERAAKSLDEERMRAILLLEAASAELVRATSKHSRSRWYFYSGGSGGAKQEIVGRTWPHINIPHPDNSWWALLTAQPLNERAEGNAITTWVKEILDPSQPHVEEVEQLFRLFLDTELLLLYRRKNCLPKSLETLPLACGNLKPDWARYFSVVAKLARERNKSKDWPCSAFSEDIRELAEMYRARAGSEVFRPDDLQLSPYEAEWKKRYT